MQCRVVLLSWCVFCLIVCGVCAWRAEEPVLLALTSPSPAALSPARSLAAEASNHNHRQPSEPRPDALVHALLISNERGSHTPSRGVREREREAERHQTGMSSRALLRHLARAAAASSELAGSASSLSAVAAPSRAAAAALPALSDGGARRAFASFGGGGAPPPPPTTYSSRQQRLPINMGLHIVPEKTAFVVERCVTRCPARQGRRARARQKNRAAAQPFPPSPRSRPTTPPPPATTTKPHQVWQVPPHAPRRTPPSPPLCRPRLLCPQP